jgi:hypothetical protein
MKTFPLNRIAHCTSTAKSLKQLSNLEHVPTRCLMHTRPWLSSASVLIALGTTLLASPNAGFAQSADQAPDVACAQSVPYVQHADRADDADQAQSAGVPQKASATAAVMQLYNAKVTDNIVVASAAQRKKAGEIALPPLTDEANGFAWPDTELGVIENGTGYAFFGSDGAFHARQDWDDLMEGNNKYGSVTRTLGTAQRSTRLRVTDRRDHQAFALLRYR